MTHREWTQKFDGVFADAVAAIAEDVASGSGFEHSLEHYADLYQIEPDALRHEWNLRKAGDR